MILTLRGSDKLFVLPGSRCSSVGIDIRLRAGWPKSTGLLPGRDNTFLSSKLVDSPCSLGSREISPGGKAAGACS
jgi:hypothetical protein